MKSVINCLLVIMMFSYSKTITPEEIYIKDEKIVKKETIIPKREIVSDLHILHPAFRNKVVMMLYECKKQGIELMVVETYRTHERQNKLRKRGRTGLSGGSSKHQHYLAVDVVPIVKKKAIWHNYKLWKKIGKIGENQGLTWGGKWPRLKDYGHFEYSCPLDSVYNIPIPDVVIIPLN